MYKSGFRVGVMAALLCLPWVASAATSPAALRAAALSSGWDIKRMAVNDAGAVAFAGGDFQGEADGIVFSAPSRFYRVASLGYEAPDSPGLAYAGFAGRYSGDIALNNAGDVIYSASLVECSQIDVAACLQTHPRVNALFRFSDPQMKGSRLVIAGEPVPGRPEYLFFSFDRVWVNASGDVVFRARLIRQDGTSQALPSGLFLWSQGNVQTIAVEGDTRFDPNSPEFSLSFADDGVVVFFSPVGETVYRFANGSLTTLLAPGMGWPYRGQLQTIFQAAPNRAGQVVLHGSVVSSRPGQTREEHGIYLFGADRSLQPILADGDPLPAGGHVALTWEETDRFGGKYIRPADVPFQLNDDGMAVFAVPVTSDTTVPKTPFEPAGLFSYRRGKLEAIVMAGDPRPDDPSRSIGFTSRTIDFQLNNTGLVAFKPEHGDIFLASDGQLAPLVLRGGSTEPQEGVEYSFQDFKSLLLNGSRTVAVQASICCGPYVEGIFLARPHTPEIPNGGFEAADENGIPRQWPTWWTNSGSGDVRQYNSGGRDSYDWYATMRLHTGPGGGAVFALSDPVNITPGATYMVESRMRFYVDTGDACFFTVLQYDSTGKQVAENEVLGSRDDSHWSWQPMRVLLYAVPDAVSLRYRFGLISATEKYLDVDGLQ